MLCKHEDRTTISDASDDHDIKRVICKKCQKVLEESVVVDGEAEKTRRPVQAAIVIDGDIESIKQQVAARRVAEGFDPANLRRGDEGDAQLVVKGQGRPSPKELPSAEDLAALSDRIQSEKRETAVGSIVADILSKAKLDVLDGLKESIYLVSEERCSGSILRLVLADLRGRGYTCKKEAVPGQGTRIELRWKKQQRKKPVKLKRARAPRKPREPKTVP